MARRVSTRPAQPPAPIRRPAPISPDPRLVEGVALYNHRQFFECHEVLEQAWKEIDGPAKDFYKGLIQAAVAFYHWSQGNLAGALTLARSATKYLKKYPPDYGGLDLGPFVEEFSGIFTWLRRHRQRYDARVVPTLRWNAPLAS